MYLFHNDYNETAHPIILERVLNSSNVQMPGYGADAHCAHAASLICEACGNHDLAVHFLVGGTQTNLIVTAAVLRPHQALLSAESAHVNIHETGAIEATGHKVVTLPTKDGKLTADQVECFAVAQQNDENAEHVVQVKMVYISNPTELGTTYNLSELERLSDVCRKHGLYLYLDGARLGYALEARENDLSMMDIARLCDVFYVGGTKVGAMFGEAVVISNPIIADDFRYLMKQRGGMLAKGWLLGLQFETLFEDGLYSRVAKHANMLADQIRQTLAETSHPLYLPGNTNQVFTILPDTLLEKLSKNFTFMLQEKLENQCSVVRFCTSWATKPESVNALCAAIYKFSKDEEA